MNIGVLDDEKKVLDDIYVLLQDVFKDAKNIFCFQNTDELKSKFKERIDLLFIDIRLSNENGIDLVKNYHEELKDTKIIYITGYDYIEDVFDTNPFYYLQKPITKEKLLKISNKLKNNKEVISIPFNKEIKKVFLKDIRYLNSSSRTVFFNLNDGRIFKTYQTLDNIINLLPANFLRIHKSFVVNLDYVESYRKGEIILDNQMRLNISRKYIHQVETKILDNIRSDIYV